MSLQQLPITSGEWLCCFLWTSWYYFSAMKMGLGLSSSSLKLPLLEAMCFFTIDVSTLLSSTPGLWGMTDTKNFKACYWKGSNPSKGKYFALNLFFFHLRSNSWEISAAVQLQMACTHTRTNTQVPSWRLRSRAENCIFHVTEYNMYANFGCLRIFQSLTSGNALWLIIEDYVQYIICVQWEVMCGFLWEYLFRW